MWVEKYRPHRLEELVGNEDARLSLLGWLRGWRVGEKPVLLLGPPGTGKTTAVHAVARELGYSVVEMNASDTRTRKMLEDIVRSASGGVTVFGSGILLFLDEVDGLYSRQDYGGLEFIIEVARKPPIPLAMAANMRYDDKVERLARHCKTLIFRPVPARLVKLHLQHILSMEGVSLDEGVLDEIVRTSRGDMRAAINTLQAAVASGSSRQAARDEEIELPECINRLLNASDLETAVESLNLCPSPPEEKLGALHSTLLAGDVPVEHLAGALRALSDADILYGRIVKSQAWHLLKYFNRILGAGIFISRAGRNLAYSEYWLPWPLSNRAWNVGIPLRGLAGVLARFVHTSRRNFLRYFMPYLPLLMKDMKALASIPGVEEDMLKALEAYGDRAEGGKVGD
jgi:replication factor C large subunit